MTPRDLEFTGENYHGHPGLIKAIADRFGVAPANVVLTDGASMLLERIRVGLFAQLVQQPRRSPRRP